MTAISRSILLTKPMQTTWAFLNDVERVGKCLPGCQEVKVLSDAKSYWKVKVTLGIVSRVIETDVTKQVDQQANKISFSIRSKNGDLDGKLDAALSPAEQGTKLDLVFDVKAVGSFSWIINQMVGRQSDKMTEQFVSCLETSL